MAYESQRFGFLLLFVVTIFCGTIDNAESKLLFVVDPRNEFSCTTSESTSGDCVVIGECKPVVDIIQKTGIQSRESMDYLRANTCGFEGRDPKVCCPRDGITDDRNKFDEGGNKDKDSSKETGDNSGPFQNPLSLLPNKCGEDFANRIIGGERTELDEFPWMAVLEYSHGRGKLTGCGGVLITKRYVLTAAHCIRSIPSTWRLSNVRLGEYDLTIDRDCVDEGNGEKTCADPVLIVGIEREIVHEDYMKPEKFRNDIALLRLDRDIKTTRYVQPICLPESPAVSSLYWSAGWGQIEKKAGSDVKLKVSLPYFDHAQCANIYSTKQLVLGQNQICAGGRAGRDTCKGDSGGPLMKQSKQLGRANKWTVDGIVSIGHSPCGLPGWPAVYTKVYNFLPWILSKLRP